MIRIFVFSCFFLVSVYCDDKKWVWNNNNRNDAPRARYEVFENEPQNAPLVQRPPIRPDPALFVPNQRPGGLYGPENQGGNYGPGHGNYNNNGNGNTYHPEDGILTGPIPSWVKQGPIKNFDRCKCAEKFNCNSPGISYGHCDVGKQYCCYSIKKSSQIGGPIPARPVNRPENGILVGPQRPINRPPPLGGNFGPTRGGNIHSLENGILVGPGGPFDIPNRGGLRSQQKRMT